MNKVKDLEIRIEAIEQFLSCVRTESQKSIYTKQRENLLVELAKEVNNEQDNSSTVQTRKPVSQVLIPSTRH